MPVLSSFYGLNLSRLKSRVFSAIIIKISMYFNDTVQHHKPHIHVFYAEFEAVIGLDGEMLAGSLPKKQYKLVSGWVALREDELYAAWIEAVRGNHPDKIEPLK